MPIVMPSAAVIVSAASFSRAQHGFQDPLYEICHGRRDSPGGQHVSLRDRSREAGRAIDERKRKLASRNAHHQDGGQLSIGWPHASAGQAGAKLLPASSKPALDRAHGSTQQSRGLLVGETLQVAQDDGPPMPFRQSRDLILEMTYELFSRIALDGLSLAQLPGGLCGARASRRAAVERASHATR